MHESFTEFGVIFRLLYISDFILAFYRIYLEEVHRPRVISSKNPIISIVVDYLIPIVKVLPIPRLSIHNLLVHSLVFPIINGLRLIIFHHAVKVLVRSLRRLLLNLRVNVVEVSSRNRVCGLVGSYLPFGRVFQRLLVTLVEVVVV